MTTSVKYSPRAAGALGFLKSSLNDIDIFVEDTSNRNMWLAYLKRHLPNSVNFSSVTMLGGRDVVVNACEIYNESRPALFIIDSDLDIILDRRMKRKRNLYSIPAYCIENMLLEDMAVADVATSFDIEISAINATKRLSVSGFMAENGRSLRMLFVSYAVASVITPNQETIGYGCNNFYIDSKFGVTLCPKKSTKRAISILRQARKENPKVFFNLYKNIKIRARNMDPITFCSAKDYILPPLHIAMCKSFGFKGNVNQLKVHLAKSSYIRRDRSLVAAINKSLRQCTT